MEFYLFVNIPVLISLLCCITTGAHVYFVPWVRVRGGMKYMSTTILLVLVVVLLGYVVSATAMLGVGSTSIIVVPPFTPFTPCETDRAIIKLTV